MARPSKYGLTEEEKAIAADNGIPYSTVLYRLRRGWDKQKAITETSQKSASHSRDEQGNFISPYSYKLGKIRSFKLPEDLDPKFDEIVEASGKSVDEYVRDLVAAWVKKLPRRGEQNS